jgi:hypothetical protein
VYAANISVSEIAFRGCKIHMVCAPHRPDIKQLLECMQQSRLEHVLRLAGCCLWRYARRAQAALYMPALQGQRAARFAATPNA